jgi:hypothetical protein
MQVVVALGAGLAGLVGPEVGALATGLSPLALAGLNQISETINSRRLGHAAETVTDAAQEFGAETDAQFVEFIEACVSDEQHQELLARALTIAQDTAMRDKRRALGRCLAAAAEETGTKLDAELEFIRVLADLDAGHVRVLRLLGTVPEHLAQQGYTARQWYPWSIGHADPGLADLAWARLATLARHGLAWSAGEYHAPGGLGMQPQYEITPYGDWFLTRLADPE